jgi:hypothetical protein
VAAPLAHIAPPNNERLEICTDLMLRTFVMIMSFELTATATLGSLSIRRQQAPSRPPSKIAATVLIKHAYRIIVIDLSQCFAANFVPA